GGVEERDRFRRVAVLLLFAEPAGVNGRDLEVQLAGWVAVAAEAQRVPGGGVLGFLRGREDKALVSRTPQRRAGGEDVGGRLEYFLRRPVFIGDEAAVVAVLEGDRVATFFVVDGAILAHRLAAADREQQRQPQRAPPAR